MFVPPAFAETDPAKLAEFIERNSFGLLVTHMHARPLATHIPFLLDRDRGPMGTLVGHVARANPQWQDAAGQIALVVFSGPHHYISPSWYEAEQVVPTWNYAAVHVYGSLRTIEDRSELWRIVARTIQRYESGSARPWRLQPDDPIVDRLLPHIVGFEVQIERWEGKFKLSQNQPPERRRRVVKELESLGTPAALTMAQLMTEALLNDGNKRCSPGPP